MQPIGNIYIYTIESRFLAVTNYKGIATISRKKIINDSDSSTINISYIGYKKILKKTYTNDTIRYVLNPIS